MDSPYILVYFRNQLMDVLEIGTDERIVEIGSRVAIFPFIERRTNISDVKSRTPY